MNQVVDAAPTEPKARPIYPLDYASFFEEAAEQFASDFNQQRVAGDDAPLHPTAVRNLFVAALERLLDDVVYNVKHGDWRDIKRYMDEERRMHPDQYR